MSENIDSDSVVENVNVEETTVVEETATEDVAETPVIEEIPVVTTSEAEEKPAAKAEIKDFVNNKDAVVVYASRDLTLNKLGKTLKAGFNVVEITEARHWLSLGSVRPATPAEVAKEFGK